MAPCLDVYAAGGGRSRRTRRQKLLAEMFTAAQLAQGGITSQQIAQASATLAENTRNPKVGEAIRLQRDLKGKLDTLYSQRDDLTQAQRQGAPTNPEIVAQAAALDKQIDETRAKMADADAALQAASPNYGQLVQQVVTAQDVFAALHPGEAFAAITLADQDGWVFLLRNNTITVSKVAVGLPEIAGLVKRIREGIELTTAGLPPFDIADAQRLYKLTLGGVAPQLDGVKALVVAPSGPLLSLPFEVLLTGPARPDPSGGRAVAGAAIHPGARAGAEQFRQPAQDRHRLARDQALVRLRRLQAGDAGAGAAQLPRRDLRRQRAIARRPAAAAVRRQGTERGARPAGRQPVGRIARSGLHRRRRC